MADLSSQTESSKQSLPPTEARDLLYLMVRNRDNILFSGEVVSLSSFNKKGKFDVLERHANFISLVSKSLLIGLKDGTEKEIKIDNGVMRVLGNRVEVYLGIRGRV